MYIVYQDINYPCNYQVTKQSITYGNLPDVFPVAVEGEILLYSNGGLLRKKDNTKNYLRVVRSGNVLTLTNIPELVEPEEPEVPAEPIPSLEERVVILEEELAESKAKNAILEAQLTNTQLALCEVYELVI